MSTRKAEQYIQNFRAIQTKLSHFNQTLSDEEFVDLLSSKTKQLAQSQVSLVENLLPPLNSRNDLSLTDDSVYTVFDRPAFFAKRDNKLGALIPGGGGMMISSQWTDAREGEDLENFNVFFLDWLTVAIARARARNVTDYVVPKTLYLRPSGISSGRFPVSLGEFGESGTSGEGSANPITGIPSKFTRTFRWHILDSSEFSTYRNIFLAIVTTWNSTTAPPIVWVFWTYIRKGQSEGSVGPVWKPTDFQYDREKKFIDREIRKLSFDPQGIYRPNHFIVASHGYIDLSLGQFVGLMFSAEFHGSHYSPIVLNKYVEDYIQHIIPGGSTWGDDSDAIRTMLFGLEPPVNIALETSGISVRESPYAFPILNDLPLVSPHEYAITPDKIAFEPSERKTIVDLMRELGIEEGESRVEEGESRVEEGESGVEEGELGVEEGESGVEEGELGVEEGEGLPGRDILRRVEDDYRIDELYDLDISIIDPDESNELLRRDYPEDRYYIKRRGDVEGARDEAIYIKKAHLESEGSIPNVVGIIGNRLIFENVGKALEDSTFGQTGRMKLKKGEKAYEKWLRIPMNKERFLKDVKKALTALWKQGYIHGDLGTDRPPLKPGRKLGDKAARRNITYNELTNSYHVIDFDKGNMIPKDTDPKFSIRALSSIPYSNPVYPRIQAIEIYKILVEESGEGEK